MERLPVQWEFLEAEKELAMRPYLPPISETRMV
jgi:hypothetical protein